MAISVKGLERAFNPRTVAVVGDKRGQGYFFLKSLRSFQGKVYSVQIDPQEIAGIEALGFTNYLSLRDIPEDIDYVICSVPRAVSPRIVADCIAKRVGAVTLFTSNFAETGTEEGRQVQEFITRMAQEAGLMLIGPNCMGIYNPRLGLRFHGEQPYGEGGRVGFISQSGNHVEHLSLIGPQHGVKLAKGVSYGNAIVLDSPDFLDYFVRDKEVEIIGLYVEWTRNGRRLFQALKGAVSQKPVVLWKGGETEDGMRASFSHTAALAQAPLVWQSMIKQVGAIPVTSMEEMVDTLSALLYLKPPRGERMGLIAQTGGQSVVVADAFARAGLRVPPLTPASYEKVTSFFRVIGGSYRNPFDISGELTPEELEQILGLLEEDGNIDNIGVELGLPFLSYNWERDPQFLDRLLDILAQFKQRSPKPIFVIHTPAHLEVMAAEIREKITARGIPTFPTFARAAIALRRVLDYYQRRNQG